MINVIVIVILCGRTRSKTQVQEATQYGSLYLFNYLSKESMFTLCCSHFPCCACFTASQVIPSKDSYFILLAVLEFKLETC